MTEERFAARLAETCAESLPLPAGGDSGGRLRRLMAVGREDLSLAKLAEAHWDAVAILAEDGRPAVGGAIYGVWASEIPGEALRMEASPSGYRLSGRKMFCSGAGLIDRALVTVAGGPKALLIELDLRRLAQTIEIDGSAWTTEAFRLTQTSTVTFMGCEISADAVVGGGDWYGERAGFWHGACGPAACWVGGVAGLVDFAMHNKRDDAHTRAHLAAMHADVWGMSAMLEAVGREMDANPADAHAAQIRALTLRHLVEQACSDTLRRFARAYGPSPLAMREETARRYLEADLYLRQTHGERDLEMLAKALRAGR